VRAGSFGDPLSTLASSTRLNHSPVDEDVGIGFRVASIPESSTGVLAVMACGLMWVLRKRFK